MAARPSAQLSSSPPIFSGEPPLTTEEAAAVSRARRAARSELPSAEAWQTQGLAWGGRPAEPAPVGVIAREDARGLSAAAFAVRYEGACLPCILTHATSGWAASRGAWTPAALLARGLGMHRARCGEDDDGRPVKLPLGTFLRYAAAQRDDSPLYVFATIDDGAEGLVDDYAVPRVFGEDLFELLSERRRPPHRWVLLGPSRSGTAVHIDPLGTSAWNALVAGTKAWALFPPGTPRDVVRGRKHLRRGDPPLCVEAVDYFRVLLPRILRSGDAHGALVFVQRAGETVYVPGGWWHAVVNVDDSIAVTQNFAHPARFDTLWREVTAKRRGMARQWLSALRRARPELAARADALNASTGWDAAALSAAHHARKAAKEAARRARKAERHAAAKRRRRDDGSGSSSDSDRDSSDSGSDSSDSSSTSSGSSSSGSVTSLSSLDTEERRRRRSQAARAAAGVSRPS